MVPMPSSAVYRHSAAVSGRQLQLEQGLRVTGDLRSNGDLTLKKSDSVTGNLSAAGRITVPNGATVSGSVTPGAPSLSLPPLPTEAQARAFANRIFERETTLTDATIDDVLFVAGDVHVQGSLNGRGTLIVGGDLSFEDLNGGHSATLLATTRLSILAFNDLHIGKGRALRGLLYAGKTAELAENVSLEGVLLAFRDIHVGQSSQLVFQDFDTAPPVISGLLPADGALLTTATPTLQASFADDLSGVDPASVRLVLDGVDRTAAAQVTASGLSWTPAAALPDGTHAAILRIADFSGKTAQASWSFVTHTAPPPPPVVVITTPVDGIFVNTPSIVVRGTFTSGGPIASCTVNDAPATVAGNGFQAAVSLVEGVNPITVVATDAAGHQGVAQVAVVLDTTPPVLRLDSPLDGERTNQSTVRVAGTAVDENSVAAVLVNGSPVVQTGGSFETSASLVEGANTVLIRAVDEAGNRQDLSVQVTLFTLPTVVITSPPDLAYLAVTTTDVAGTVDGNVASVVVNGVDAVIAGTSFVARDVPLLEGGNVLTAVATDARGHVGTASRNVVRDLTPPRLSIDFPADGARIADSMVTVSGLVNDIVDGTVNASEATVTVNGRPAVVSNRSFVVDVPLLPGDNLLTARAVDRSGNVGLAIETVHSVPASLPRIAIVAGDRQQGALGTLLPAPFTVALLDAGGQPAIGRTVLFKVSGINGTLAGGKREIAVPTGPDGRASAPFTLGTRVGAGSPVVEASALGYPDAAVFRATVLPGSPALLVVDSGNQQYGAAGQALPRPLVAVVTDSGFNRLPGVPVRFKISKGQGHFADGSQELVQTTDSDGRAIVSWVLGPEEGIANNVAEARLDSQPNGPLAGFAATGRVAGDPSQTSVSGLVLDNANQPVPGVTLRVLDSALTAQTDAQGVFHLAGAPVGTVRLVVDGSTTQRPGAWPDLEFVLTTVAGRDTTLGMPIYLLPLNLASGLVVDEVRGGTLTLPELPGFALAIQPGSVTFPGGGKSGVVSVTVVHNDKVPMVPNFGQQPRLIVTIQPAGARFEPPARLTLPNVEGLAPGEVTELYSFDHDLGHFVSIGPATVSDDGSVVTSNRGVGIVKAGWHCGGNPASSGTPAKCPDCEKCTGTDCVADPNAFCNSCKPQGKGCNGRGDCLTGRELIPYPGMSFDLPIGSRQTLGRDDPLATCPSPIVNPCFAAVRELLGPISAACNSGIDLKGAILEETESSKGTGCAGVQPILGPGCVVVDGNKLLSVRDRTIQCNDTHSICGPFPPPLAPTDPPRVCTMVNTQTFFLDRVEILTRTITYTITRTYTACTVNIQ